MSKSSNKKQKKVKKEFIRHRKRNRSLHECYYTILESIATDDDIRGSPMSRLQYRGNFSPRCTRYILKKLLDFELIYISEGKSKPDGNGTNRYQLTARGITLKSKLLTNLLVLGIKPEIHKTRLG